MNNFPKGNDLIVKWAIKYSDGTPFPLENYAWELCYSAGRGINVVKDTAVISVSDNLLTWRFSGKDQAFYGKYSLTLRLYQQGKIVATVRKNNAFELSTTQYDGPCDIDLVSYCDNISLQDALLRGNKAMDVAQDAKAIAGSAVNTAAGAVTTANEAKTIASTANNTSTEAKTIANNAKTVADQAKATADATAATATQKAEEVAQKEAQLEAALNNLSTDQSGALALSTKVNEHGEKLSELDELINGAEEEVEVNITPDADKVGKAWNFGNNADGASFTTIYPSTFEGAVCYKVSVVAGQKYKVKGYAASNYQGLFVKTNLQGVILTHVYGNALRNEITITITEDGYLYVNLINYDSTIDYVHRVDTITTAGLVDKVGDVTDLVSDEKTNLVGAINELADKVAPMVSDVADLKGVVSQSLVEQTSPDYGIRGGWSFTNISIPTDVNVSAELTDDGLMFTKTGASKNAFVGAKLTSITNAGTYRFNVLFNGVVVNNEVSVYNKSSVKIYSGILADNKGTFDFELTSADLPIIVIFGFPYNYTSRLMDVTVINLAEEGVKVTADGISDRVASLEGKATIPFKSGRYNTFLGTDAGKNTSEDVNVESADDGNFNTAVGVESFLSNTLGDHCTAIGFCSLKHNTTGNNNTALGEDALFENTTGSQNVSIGQHSSQDSNGSYNVAIGSNVARRHASGNMNVFIGAECGNNPNEEMTGGSNNVLIGAYQGNKDNYSNCIAIMGKYPTENNQIRLGNSSHTSVIIAGKRINFNADGSVTWENL